jgi:hypothetical protein
MLAKKPDDRLDNVLESTLARCANIDAPVGLEDRILAELARRKARRGRSMQIAAFVLLTTLSFSTLYRPVNSAEVSANRPDKTVQPTIELLEDEEPELKPAYSPGSVQTLLVAEPVEVVPEFDVAEWEPTDDDSFISDFEVESLSMATLALSDLSSTP